MFIQVYFALHSSQPFAANRQATHNTARRKIMGELSAGQSSVKERIFWKLTEWFANERKETLIFNLLTNEQPFDNKKNLDDFVIFMLEIL